MASATLEPSILATAAGPTLAGRAFVEARNVVKRYRSGVVANDGMRFDAALGEVVALLGPNGAGKTTFVLQLLGLLKPTSGSVFIGEVDVVRDPASVKRLVSYQPQGHTAMGGVEVRHALVFTGRLRGLRTAQAEQQCGELVNEFGLESILNRPLNQLSGGWRRLVDVAVAFMGDPRLIVLDEPTNDLDPVHRQRVWERVNSLRHQRQVTCLLVTHNLLEAERVVDRVVIIQHGQVAADGSPGVLKSQFGDSLRLDVYLRAGCHPADLPVALTRLGAARLMRPGHVQFLLERAAATDAMAVLMVGANRDFVDDFRLAPPSLEDVYARIEKDSHAPRPT